MKRSFDINCDINTEIIKFLKAKRERKKKKKNDIRYSILSVNVY